MTQIEVIREICRIATLAYRSIGNYSRPSDGFCDLCPNHNSPDTFRNSGHIIDYIRSAVLEKLKRDGHSIHEGFDSETGKEINPLSEEEIQSRNTMRQKMRESFETFPSLIINNSPTIIPNPPENE